MKRHLYTTVLHSKILYTIVFTASVILLGSFSLAQRNYPTEAEELRILKQDYRLFLIAQGQIVTIPSSEEEMRLIKQEYRAFLLEQRKTTTLLATEQEKSD